MTSWIIVSSRWVLGSSNGMRAFSASSTTARAAATSTATGIDGTQMSLHTFPMAWERERVPVARTSAAMASSSAGSASAENATSRLAPMPSNADPVSRAASTTKKRAVPRR